MNLRDISRDLEVATGSDSIQTIETHYRAYDSNKMDYLPGMFECVYPQCKFRRSDPEKMWIHVHFGSHGPSFGCSLDELLKAVES